MLHMGALVATCGFEIMTMRLGAMVLSLLLSAGPPNIGAVGHRVTRAQSERSYSKEFWLSITKNSYAPPEGASVPDLARSLVALLGSPDPELRDEIGYSTLASWIYEKRLLSPDDMRPLIQELLDNLGKEIGSVGTDAVLQRSFSALVLSVVVARDNAAPFLKENEFRRILQGALSYADSEKDLRGYDPQKGWVHSAAHTADLLKFLGRSRYLTTPDQAAILSAIRRKLRSADVVFSFGEDERLARAVLSIIVRSDFDANNFHEWLASCKPTQPRTARPQISQSVEYQNSKNILAKLDVLLLGLPPDAPHAKDSAAAVQETLKGAF